MHRATVSDTASRHGAAAFIWGIVRIALGWIFLWAFLDKLFGFGYSTPSGKSWLDGGSPTTGYLDGVKGPFAWMYHPLAGQAWVDWVFMIGLLGIGVALILGIAMRLATLAGVVMLVLMWGASLPLTTNPFFDEHLMYALVLIGLVAADAGDTLGLGKPWSRSRLVRALPLLR